MIAAGPVLFGMSYIVSVRDYTAPATETPTDTTDTTTDTAGDTTGTTETETNG